MVNENCSELSDVAAFYQDRCVLITGATGFMGKVLVEKLLRSCPGVKTIYLLMRPKSGSDVRARLEELLAAKLFDHIRTAQPDVVSKLHPICGDITQPELGISPSDAKLLADEVSVVFHAAATVKFDEPLKLSINMNVLGTKRLIKLCHKMSKLAALVHVSTAYCNCDREEVNEVIYPPPVDPNKLIAAVEWMDEDLVDQITPKLIGNRPNTYTYTKSLAEHVLIEDSGSLPLAIVRPSIVTAAWREPVPGWVDNMNGPTGLIAGAGKGLLRSLVCYRNMVADLVPVDIPINLMISVAWYTATVRPNSTLVYNCTSGEINPIRWGDVETNCLHYLTKSPFENVIWYPGGCFKNNDIEHFFSNLVYQMIPAYLMDFTALLTGRKRFMVRLHKKMARAVSCLRYFTTHQWRFTCDNLRMLLARLSPRDRETFNFDVRDLHWPSYLENYCGGTRKFVLKEDIKSLPASRAHLRKLYWTKVLVNFGTILLALRLLHRHSEHARKLWATLFSLIAHFRRVPDPTPLTSPMLTTS